jgi:hypothetical protein
MRQVEWYGEYPTPTGELKIKEIKLEQTAIIKVSATLIDEAGLVWDSSYPKFRSEFREPISWPQPLLATYVIEETRSERWWKEKYSVTAETEEAAIHAVRNTLYTKNVTLTVIGIRKPSANLLEVINHRYQKS